MHCLTSFYKYNPSIVDSVIVTSQIQAKCHEKLKVMPSLNPKIDQPYPKEISVVILCEELKYTEQDKHIIDTALALANYGHKVVIIANKIGLKKEYKKIKKKVDIMVIGKFIPKSIFGYFQNHLLSVWSIYAAFFTSLCKPKGCINVIFCDRNILALPILNVIGSYKIIQFHNLYGVNKNANYNFRSIKYVNEVLFPNKSMYNVFNNEKISKTVLYPCVSTTYNINKQSQIYGNIIPRSFLLPTIPRNYFLFVLLGEYLPKSNFELIIDALAILTRKIRKHNAHKIHLIIAGSYNKTSQDQISYCSYLMQKTRQYNLCKNITFINSLHHIAKKSLIEHSVAYIHTSTQDVSDRHLLEAMSLSKTIIATISGFSLEILEHGITGYILPPEPIRFAEIMHEAIYNPDLSLGKRAFREFQNRFSFQKFAKDINKLVMKYSDTERRNRLLSYRIRNIVKEINSDIFIRKPITMY